MIKTESTMDLSSHFQMGRCGTGIKCCGQSLMVVRRKHCSHLRAERGCFLKENRLPLKSINLMQNRIGLHQSEEFLVDKLL